LFGSDENAVKAQFLKFFSEADYRADRAMQTEIGQLRDDVGRTWLQEPLSIEETAERFVRPQLRKVFVNLMRGSIGDYLDRFEFKVSGDRLWW
jgi:hypothetical protein